MAHSATSNNSSSNNNNNSSKPGRPPTFPKPTSVARLHGSFSSLASERKKQRNVTQVWWHQRHVEGLILPQFLRLSSLGQLWLLCTRLNNELTLFKNALIKNNCNPTAAAATCLVKWSSLRRPHLLHDRPQLQYCPSSFHSRPIDLNAVLVICGSILRLDSALLYITVVPIPPHSPLIACKYVIFGCLYLWLSFISFISFISLFLCPSVSRLSMETQFHSSHPWMIMHRAHVLFRSHSLSVSRSIQFLMNQLSHSFTTFISRIMDSNSALIWASKRHMLLRPIN